METNVIYKYRAPGALPDNDRTITTETIDLDPRELLPRPRVIGETITLQADNPEKFGEQPREYRVLLRWPLLTQFGESGGALALLYVVVTDPDT